MICDECGQDINSHDLQCPNRIKTTTERTLYCICYEFRIRKGYWGTDKLYMHADSAGDARLQFMRSNAPETMREIRIVGVAPVIGYFVDDKKGQVLSV